MPTPADLAGPDAAAFPAPPTLLAQLDNQQLQLILMPTEACNFRCTYCYEDFQLGRMPADVIRGVKALLSARVPELHLLTLTWFGGEPLLALPTLLDVLDHAQELGREHPAVNLCSDITTNGYLLDLETFRRLHARGVRFFQISFDGPREWHDRKRVLAGGRGTFDRIWQNVLALRELEGEFRVMLRLHVDEENAAAMEELIGQCQGALGDDQRFSLLIRPLSRLGGPNDAELPVLEDSHSAEVVSRLRHLARARDMQLHPTQGTDTPLVCYAANSNSYVIRSDGRVGKCTVALDDPANQIGRLHEDGRLKVSTPAVLPWMRGHWSQDPEALACPMHGLAGEPYVRTG